MISSALPPGCAHDKNWRGRWQILKQRMLRAGLISRHIVIVACRIAFHETMDAEAQRNLGLKLHELVELKTRQQQGRLAQRLAEGFTCLFNWPRVIQGAEERACALALAIMDGARTLREAGLKKYMREGVHGVHLVLCCTTVSFE